MKKCTFCAEEIQDEAIKCRFCGEFLDGRSMVVQHHEKPKWYFKTSTLIGSFLFLGPLILPLIWLNPRYSRAKKTGFSLIIAAISLALFKGVLLVSKSLTEYYQLMQGIY